MSDESMCAHLRVSYRSLQEKIQEKAGYVTRGWWECDSGCGAKFFPTAGMDFLLDAWKAHHAHYHSECNVDGPVALPSHGPGTSTDGVLGGVPK